MLALSPGEKGSGEELAVLVFVEPRALDVEQPQAGHEARERQCIDRELRNRLVCCCIRLVVEDVHRTVSDLQEVDVAGDGYQGIMTTAYNMPDLIIVDLNMPHIDGVEMIKLLRADQQFLDMPILAVTAYGMERAEQAVKEGADRALAKPFDPDILFAFIEELLKRKKPHSKERARAMTRHDAKK